MKRVVARVLLALVLLSGGVAVVETPLSGTAYADDSGD